MRLAAAWRATIMLLLAMAAALPSCAARADTVVSLLGNYTINQFAGLQVGPHRVKLHYVVVMGQIPALEALHKADSNNDGVTTQRERDAYLKRLSPQFARNLKLRVDGRRLPLHLGSWHTGLPSDVSGFSLRFDVYYVATLPRNVNNGVHQLRLDNTNYKERNGWREMVVKAGPGVSIFNTNAFDTSLTEALRANPGKLPPGGPLNERRVHMRFTQGAVPAGTHKLGPRHGPLTGSQHEASPASQGNHRQQSGWWPWISQHLLIGVLSPSTDVATGASGSWLQAETKRVVGWISPQHRVGLGIEMLVLLIALGLGATHAFSPGHGKTVVGAYLVGSRGTPRHAAFLGLTVTLTHTAGVFILGGVTLLASRYIVPDKLFPILSLVSGLLVVVIGMSILINRFRHLGKHDHVHVGHQYVPVAADGVGRPAIYNPHSHSHAHVDVDGTLWHSHGGSLHAHQPPGAAGERVTWKRLLALGVSGGLVPCPSAMVLMLAAIAAHKTAYGMVLVLAFSIGLALALTAVGLVFLYARRTLGRGRMFNGRFVQAMPILSAALIIGIGLLMCYSVIATTGAGL